MTLSILIIDDDLLFASGLNDLLQLQGHVIRILTTIGEYKKWRLKNTCDVLLVDRKLPDGDGNEIIKMHRLTYKTPIIVISGLTSTSDRISSIDMDADYYFNKPLSFDELLAIIKKTERNKENFDSDAWIIDTIQWTITSPNNFQIPLTKNEIQFLCNFIESPGELVPKSYIAKSYGMDYLTFDFRRVDTLTRRLKDKIKKISSLDFPINSAYGKGIVFNSVLRKK